MLVSLLVIFTIYPLIKCDTAGLWNYEPHGAHGVREWHKIFPDCKANNSQSPINIDTDATVKAKSSIPLTFHNYNETLKYLAFKNTFKTVKIDFGSIPDDKRPQIEGGDLVGRYKLLQVHFHWGYKDSEGSEHTINDKSYPCEIHLVHERMNSSNEEPDEFKYAVLGSLCEVTNSQNDELQHVFDATKILQTRESQQSYVTSLQPFALIPKYRRDSFYRYKGSLTTPPCSAVVIWTVFDRTVRINMQQLTFLRQAYFERESSYVGNFRPVQPLFGRPIYKYDNSANTIAKAQLFLSVAVVISLYTI